MSAQQLKNVVQLYTLRWNQRAECGTKKSALKTNLKLLKKKVNTTQKKLTLNDLKLNLFANFHSNFSKNYRKTTIFEYKMKKNFAGKFITISGGGRLKWKRKRQNNMIILLSSERNLS